MSEVPNGYLGTEGRIGSGPAPALVDAGYALEIADAPLLHHGLGLADLAHVLVLHEAGVIPDGAAGTLLGALLDLLETAPEEFPYDPVYGDAYNSRERELERRLGDVAGWLHTGRTRREAGRTAFRLVLRDRGLALQEAVIALVRALLARAEEHAGTLWNDTTYLQPAQPSTFGHYLLGFAEEAARDLDRLDAVVAWADRSPAGVGGVNGTRIPLDRARLAGLLGFAAVGGHSRDVMWSVDGLVDAAVAAMQAATTVDRLAEDLEILTSPQFGFVELDASVCRASVLLPQKRNPYGLSVIRGGTNVLIGQATGLMATQRTPSARTDNWLYGYGQVAAALDLARRLVALGATVVSTLRIDADRLASSATEHFTAATDLADELVLQGGLDYRSCYRIVARRAAAAYGEGRTRFDRSDVEAIATEAQRRGAPADPDRLAAALDPRAIIATRTAVGGAAAERVAEACRELAASMGRRERQASDRRRVSRSSEQDLVRHARGVATRAH